MDREKIASGASTLAFVLLMAGQASAQAVRASAPANISIQQDGPAASDGEHLEEITVTAQRRSENLQKTPLTISALSGATLAARGVNTVSALGNETPSLQIADSGGGTTQIFMRGVGSSNVTEVGDSAIALQMDGIYIARPNSFGASLYDLDRIEVLRGPQGTLYGRNATAGAINVITKRPTRQFGGNAAVEFGNYNELLTTGALNIPLSDTLAIRTSFQTIRHDGYQKSIGPGNDKQDQDDKAARVQALWEPSSRFSILLRADYMTQGGNGGGDIAYPLTDGPRHFNSQINTDLDNKFWSVGAEAHYDLGFADLTYLTGYNSTHIDRLRENVTNHLPNYLNLNTNTLSNELRLGKSSGNIKWVVGLYAFREHTFTDYKVYRGTSTNTYTDYLSPKVRANSKAAFGQFTYSITPRLRVTGGIRYTHDDKSRYGGVYITDANGNMQSTVSINAASDTWSSTNWKAGIDYDLTSRVLLYATAGTGYKAGGYYDGLPPNAYQPERITAYEVGVKSRFLDNRAQLNVDGYFYNYRDFQVTAQRLLDNTLSSITLNADKAQLYGIEAEGSFLVTPNDRIDGYVTWEHTEYKNFVLSEGDAITNNDSNIAYSHCYATYYSGSTPREASFNGCPLAKAPKWTINFGYQHTFDLGNHGRLIPRAQVHFETMKYLEYHGFDQNVQGSYTRTDLTLTYEPERGNWSVMLFCRNLENHNILVNSSPNTGTGLASNGSGDYYAPPRTFGGRVSVTF